MTSETTKLDDFATGGIWDAEAHVRFLRSSAGASSGFTADLIENLYSALTATRPEAVDTIDRPTSTGEVGELTRWDLEPTQVEGFMVIDATESTDGRWVKFEDVALYASPREGHVEVPVEVLRNAVLSCSHTITAEEIVLRRSDRMGGNALNQLHQRLAAALGETKP